MREHTSESISHTHSWSGREPSCTCHREYLRVSPPGPGSVTEECVYLVFGDKATAENALAYAKRRNYTDAFRRLRPLASHMCRIAGEHNLIYTCDRWALEPVHVSSVGDFSEDYGEYVMFFGTFRWV